MVLPGLFRFLFFGRWFKFFPCSRFRDERTAVGPALRICKATGLPFACVLGVGERTLVWAVFLGKGSAYPFDLVYLKKKMGLKKKKTNPKPKSVCFPARFGFLHKVVNRAKPALQTACKYGKLVVKPVVTQTWVLTGRTAGH